MEIRSLPVIAGLIAAFLLSPVAGRAAEGGPSPEQEADWQRRLDQAKVQKEQAKELQDEAKSRYEAENVACFKKFRVTACQDAAKQQYVAATKEGRRADNEAKALERQVKKEQLADQDARRIEEAPQREADLREREAAARAERDAAASKRDKRLADRAAKEAEGERRQAADAERIRQKRENHDQKVADKVDKARQRDTPPADK